MSKVYMNSLDVDEFSGRVIRKPERLNCISTLECYKQK